MYVKILLSQKFLKSPGGHIQDICAFIVLFIEKFDFVYQKNSQSTHPETPQIPSIFNKVHESTCTVNCTVCLPSSHPLTLLKCRFGLYLITSVFDSTQTDRTALFPKRGIVLVTDMSGVAT